MLQREAHFLRSWKSICVVSIYAVRSQDVKQTVIKRLHGKVLKVSVIV